MTNNANDKALEVRELEIHSVNWIGEQEVRGEGVGLRGRYRHQGKIVPLVTSKINKDHYKVIFKTPQKAIASGQSLVLYKGKQCVGGGVII